MQMVEVEPNRTHFLDLLWLCANISARYTVQRLLADLGDAACCQALFVMFVRIWYLSAVNVLPVPGALNDNQ